MPSDLAGKADAELRNNKSLSQKVAKGLSWLVATSLLLQALSMLTQLALAWWLSKEEFGVYALAASCTMLLQVFRDGGVQLWLARQSPDEYRSNMGDAFWLSTFASFLVAAVLCCASPLSSYVYGNEMVGKLIFLLGLTMPFQSLCIVPDAGLQASMKFREAALSRFIGVALRYILTIVFAFLGFGPYSFVLPLFFSGLAQAIYSVTHLGMLPTSFRLSFAAVSQVFRGSVWSMVGALASALFRQIDYLVIGLFAPIGIVGVYYFAYQLAIQPGTFVIENLRKVFIPSFAAAEEDPSRRERAVCQVVTAIGLVVSPLLLWFAVTCGAFETIFLKGRWASAVPATRLLSFAMPLHVFSLFAHTLLQSAGEYRFWTWTTALRGIFIGLVTATAGLFGGGENATTIAWFVSVGLAVSAIAEALLMFKKLKLPAIPLILSFLSPYVIAFLIAIIALVVVDKLALNTLPDLLLSSLLFLAGTGIAFAAILRGNIRDFVEMIRRILSNGAPTGS